jgi:CheY-like chemotaxis protein
MRQVNMAGALHEVSNALTVVLGWLNAARAETLTGPVREALDVAYKHARRGHQVARTAIGASPKGISSHEYPQDNGVTLRGDEYDAPPESDSTEWDGPVRGDRVRTADSVSAEAVLAAQVEATAKGVRLIAVGSGGDGVVEGADELCQVLVNLLLNAIAFSPRATTVQLETQMGSGCVRFLVADQGPGVPELQRKRLFERGNSMRPGGAGIGLNHSRELAVQHGGSLRLVTSEVGACFEVSWPARELPSQTVSRAPLLDGCKVLVLEDDEAVMDMVKFGLESRGATVFGAASLAEVGMLTTLHRDLDIALVDLSPLGGDYGFASRELRRYQPNVPLVLMSGSVSGSAIESGATELSVAAWVRKPFELGELYDCLGKVLSANRS